MVSKPNLAGFTREYVIDIPELDEQHKSYFDLLDTMNDVVEDYYKPLDDEEVDDVIDILDRLRDYAMVHFHTEESLMAEMDYPGLDAQKSAHNRFITDVIRMTAELMNGSSMPAIKVRNFMHDWYREHILTMDKPFGDFYKKNDT